MKFEIGYADGQSDFVEADSQQEVFDQYGYRLRNPITMVKVLLEGANALEWHALEWHTVYERKGDGTKVIAYVNLYNPTLPVASVPLRIVLEKYQSIKKHPEIVQERTRLLKLFPEADIRIQKHFAR